ncbi:rhodoquinone biosynthesis methyltransferase RquA [Microvirga sp. W0021]|uniref:Rhodoquinone biosynthesis methyltransferase RquA n=1 Tax=Hohaiivirga grylli TaxID=3133970 RepID=A0ABV0BIQ4_9HYPH
MKPERLLSSYYSGVPDYMVDVYDWAYVNPKWVAKLDNNLVVWILLFGNASRLIKAYLNEIDSGSRVWQVAHVYGDQLQQLAQKIGPTGQLELTDITPIQIEHAHQKLDAYPWVNIQCCDSAYFKSSEKFDVVGSFFLLHEVPDEKKRQIIDNMLEHVAEGGKAVFIDYHRPARWQPIRQILKLVNIVLEPFAFSIWDHEIKDFTGKADKFVWSKKTFFGGVYQYTVAKRIA